jgi:hypothetical protein
VTVWIATVDEGFEGVTNCETRIGTQLALPWHFREISRSPTGTGDPGVSTGVRLDIVTSNGKGLVQWLRGASSTSYCCLLHTEPWVPLFEVATMSVRQQDLFFFPDSYWVSFDSGRAVVITRDCDVILCQPEKGGSG